MGMRAALRGVIRGAVATAVIAASTALPYTITVDWNQPVTPLPPMATALFIASTTLLAGAGCLLRRRSRAPLFGIPPHV